MATREEMEQASFLREVDEAVAAERMKKFFKKYGIVFLIVSLVVIAGILGYEFHKSVKARRIQNESMQYDRAAGLVETNKEEALSEFSKLEQAGKTDYAVLASFAIASIYYGDGKKEEADRILARISENDKVHPVFRRLAKVSLVFHGQETEFTETTLSKIAEIEKEAAAYRPLLTELKAVLAYRSKDKAKTVSFYQEVLSDPKADESVKQRAKEVIGYLNE